jgi:pilus assembly protein CpaB
VHDVQGSGGGWRSVVAAVAWHRRLLAAGLAAASTALGLTVVAPAPDPTVPVLAAARDLPAGAPLVERDLRPLALPPDAVPEGALRPGAAVLGRAPAGPVRRGEALTDVRLVGPGLLDALGPGLVATPVRIADAGSVGLLRPGDRVDVLAARAPTVAEAGGAARASPVVQGVRVLTVPSAEDGGLADGALVVLATREPEATALAAAAVDGPLSVVLRTEG